MKALIFKASGDYARFRCPYTTTSALTYTVIHPIAVKGMIGAIMGIDYSDLYEYTKDMKIGIEVLKPVKKDTQSFNLIPQTKNNKAPSFQSRVEFLRDVSYRIYLSCEDDKLGAIEEILKSKEFTFTPYLGASEHVTKLEFESVQVLESISEEYVSAAGVVPKEIVNIDKLNDIDLNLDRIPVKNSKNREYTEYKKIAFAPNEKINVKCSNIYKAGENNVYLF